MTALRPAPHPRATRRTLHRQTRTLPLHVAHRRLVEAIERAALPDVDVRELHALFDRVWRLAGGAAWSVAELRDHRLLQHGADARRIGHALARLADARGTVARWGVVRVDTGAKKLRDGRLWRLVPRW